MANTHLPESYTSLTWTGPSTPPHLHHSPLPLPSAHEVLIKIYYAAINPVDIQLWGNPVIGWLAGKKEKGIGNDYSGTVVAVGDAVRGKWHVGDEVFGLFSRPTGDGTFSEYVRVVPGRDPIARKPKVWSWQEAAAVPLVVLTAFACLDWLPKMREKEKESRVVVSGASGGTGMWCVQLAKELYNCHVTGVCSARNAEFVKRIGADEVIDYTTQDVAKTLLASRPKGRKYDLYIDCVGGVEMFNHWHEILHKNGSYVTIVGDKTSRTAMGGPITYFTYPLQVLRFLRGYVSGPRYANVLFYAQTPLLEQVAQLGEEGKVEVVVQEIVKGVLEEGRSEEAWAKLQGVMEEGRVRGKVIVEIAH
ncbi:GroES-like protein [Massarina eburnea CBS 473.64]|uniref:GroES-like protein n=1 Tax=Massarina eburnea CBS 473.64 TaxID=1395130 RepID=A0A6A6S0G1_9PLEO|nr:GroES-like protein [Massarina eburnea CBS 473.64]